LVLASAILATGGMLVAGGYGLGHDLLVLWTLAIDAAMASLGAWLCLNVRRLRRQAVWAEPRPPSAAEAAEQKLDGMVAASKNFHLGRYDLSALVSTTPGAIQAEAIE
jgi:hypothetical protein